MAIYEVEGKKILGSKVLSLERVYGAKNAVDAITKLLASFSKDSGDIKITALKVWGTSGTDSKWGRVGTSKYDPNTLCACHSGPLWKCSTVLPSTVSIESDGISFTAGV
tara:strand:+ start:50 stop:376 length:327 start_codon:yes stop_codon:yes gene_type:complete